MQVQCSIIQSITLGFKALTVKNSTSFLPPSPLPSLSKRPPPPLCENITGTSPVRNRGETWSGREGWIHHNNSCFQITTTWGRGVGDILWAMRDCGCSFIYLHRQHRCVFVCETRSVITPFFSYQKRPEVTSPPFQAPSCNAAAICVAKWWICKENINLFGPKVIMNVWVLEKSYWAGWMPFTSLFTPFHGSHFFAGVIMLRAISYFKYANINTAWLQTGHIRERWRLQHSGAFEVSC